jgi:hypothetical protein
MGESETPEIGRLKLMPFGTSLNNNQRCPSWLPHLTQRLADINSTTCPSKSFTTARRPHSESVGESITVAPALTSNSTT